MFNFHFHNVIIMIFGDLIYEFNINKPASLHNIINTYIYHEASKKYRMIIIELN